MSDHFAPFPTQPATKAVTAWSGVGLAKFLESVGITTWGDAAAAAAFCYSCFLIIEWLYKKVYQPLMAQRTKKRQAASSAEQEE